MFIDGFHAKAVFLRDSGKIFSGKGSANIPIGACLGKACQMIAYAATDYV
jgi:hypothetical protein